MSRESLIATATEDGAELNLTNRRQSFSDEILPHDDGNNGDNTGRVPDGGWGWFVVLAAFIVHVLVDGITYSFGVFVEPMLEHMETTRAAIGWLGSILISVTWMAAPLTGGLTKKYGCRSVTVIGTLVAGFGFILSSLVTNVWLLYVTFGLAVGAGFSMQYLASIVALSDYFEKKLGFAVGLAVSGAGVGMFLLAPLNQFLIDYYNWQMALLINGGLALNGLVCAAVMIPLPRIKPQSYQTDVQRPEENTLDSSEVDDDDHYKNIPGTDFNEESKAQEGRTPNTGQLVNDAAPFRLQSSTQSTSTATDENASLSVESQTENTSLTQMKTEKRSILCSPILIIYVVSTMLNYVQFCIPYMFIPDRVQVQFGMSADSAALLMSIIGVTNTLSRVIIGYLADIPRIDNLTMFYSVISFSGILTVFSGYYSSFTSMALYCGVVGFYMGTVTCLEPIILYELMGRENLSPAFAISLFFGGISTLTSPPIAGLIYDKTLNYDNSFYMVGVTAMAATLLLVCIGCIRNRM